ncbi:MAG: tetratricopeptide repeat protein [Chitinivibrionales bacterium]|nr:tetratricopeptide repeat protein [Chitinivibrionales bacterium]
MNYPRIKLPLLFLLLALVSRAQDAGIDWIMEDALDKEIAPVFRPDITTPQDIVQALRLYHNGKYRLAADALEKTRKLNLPDGNLDFIVFVLAECYRQLKLERLAEDNYLYLTEHLPNSDKVAPAYYRLLQYYYARRDPASAEEVYELYQSRYRTHPLYSSVIYVMAKLHFKQKHYAEAIVLLSQITAQSARHVQAQFLAALANIQLKKYDNALLLLDYVRKNAANDNLVTEAGIVIGDIYLLQKKPEIAYSYYSNVARGAQRYHYARVKMASAYNEMEEYEKAEKMALSYVRRHPQSDFYFEMMSILETAYLNLGEKEKAEQTGQAVYGQVVGSRMLFEVYEEINRLTEMTAEWNNLEFQGIRNGDAQLRREAQAQLQKIRDLQARFWQLAEDIGGSREQRQGDDYTTLTVHRYLSKLKERKSRLEDSILTAQGQLELATIRHEKAPASENSTPALRIDSLNRSIDTFKTALSDLEQEYNAIIREFIGDEESRSAFSDEGPAKYVDWAFLKYLKKKQDLLKMNTSLAQRPTTDTTADTLARNGRKVVDLFTEIDRDKLAKDILKSRNMLIDHIEAMLEFYPRNKFNPQILYRLAELYYDKSSGNFSRRLDEYEAMLASGEDTAGLEFPEQGLDSVIAVYDRIIYDYPRDELADDAFFYKALALQQIGAYDEANDVLLEMTENYPESEFFVEANMNIGRYYFERPKIMDNGGYKLAEDAFREVLFYRDHPQFVQALYNLGWCYYMQDQYEEAIAVFKYLIEEVELDFDPGKMEEKQVVNPLLRGEAIDYIAISFDEEERINDAVKFLELIGNKDYAALVLKRIGELREEVQDYDLAVSVLQRLLAEYPMSSAAPQATAALIKIYETTGRKDLSLSEREAFFGRYAKASRWWRETRKRDSTIVERVDSMAISNGLFVADAAYREAEKSGNEQQYFAAAKNYRAVVDAYPQHPRAIAARWNLASLLEAKLKQPEAAYQEYLAYSRTLVADTSQREQAARNAIAIAQNLLPEETNLESGDMGPDAVRLIEAVQNYANLFPGGGSLGGVLIAQAAIYFNRKMYASAAEIYNKIIDKKDADKNYYTALFMLGQCHFGEENWQAAAVSFEKVYQSSRNEEQQFEARKLMLQSKYLLAKQFFDAGDHAKAAEAFLNLEMRFPGSEYGDVALFSAAESYEKLKDLDNASKMYNLLVRKYPTSKFAADALFNAAGNYEKLDKFDKAAEAYEYLVANYPESNKAKDALFNVGFCYEKLGKLEKMAEANERYTEKYPEEKDVKVMLLRSAQFYYKAAMYDKAENMFKNFHRRFSNDPKAIEALFMIGKIYVQRNDDQMALNYFEQAERQNAQLVEAEGKGNNYYASEAAYQSAQMQYRSFSAIEFDAAGDELLADQKRKMQLLNDASAAFARVVKYQSEKMFEAAFRIGEMYEDFAREWRRQERDQLDPIKTAVREKDIYQTTSALLQQAIVPYKKTLELKSGFDSLSQEHQKWFDLARERLSKIYVAAGDLLIASAGVMHKAPIPREVKARPLHYFQYLKQLNQTLEPVKINARDYFLQAYRDMSELDIDQSRTEICKERFAKLNYTIGNDYEKLSQKILKEEYEIPRSLSAEEKEELQFQLEDIVFELQDKSIFAYEDAMNLAKDENMREGTWFPRIMKSLAQLSPEMYGKSYYHGVSYVSDESWAVRTDSVAGWNAAQPPYDGWQAAATAPTAQSPSFPFGDPLVIAAPQQASACYFRQDIFLQGFPAGASITYAFSGAYNLYINGKLTASDTSGYATLNEIDSLTNISSLVNGGDNSIAIELIPPEGARGALAVVFSAMIDTNQHFDSKISPIRLASAKPAGEEETSTDVWSDAAETVAQDTREKRDDKDWYAKEFRNMGELLQAITDYQGREKRTAQQIRKERLELQKLRIKDEYLQSRIETVQEEVEKLQQSLEGMSQER